MKWLRRGLAAGCAVLLAVSLYQLGAYRHAAQRSRASVDALIDRAVTYPAPQPSRDPPQQDAAPAQTAPIAVDHAALQAACPDIVAWLYCPNTAIDQPVAQHADNDYYLHHLTDGRENAAGTLFLDCRNAADLTDWVQIIYGHNMKDGSRFAILPRYSEQAFYEAHPVWYLLTPACDLRVELVAGFVTTSDAALYTLPHSRASKEALLESALAQSDFRSAVTPTDQDRVVVFSTCSYASDTARYVLVGVLRTIE
ncbi:MAG: class B sortase [Eubacteriales bacterium]|nr:class B sortase [Eubacteriales bacterium]